MSTMTYSARSASYREMEILSASPGRLVVMMFDHLMVQFERARIAIDRGDIELQTVSLGKARAIVSELLATLDFEKGGEIAAQLSALYTFMLSEMVDIGFRRDSKAVSRLAFMATELRDGFSGAVAQEAQARRSA